MAFLTIILDTNGDEIFRQEYPTLEGAIVAAVRVCGKNKKRVTAKRLESQRVIRFRPDGGVWIIDI